MLKPLYSVTLDDTRQKWEDYLTATGSWTSYEFIEWWPLEEPHGHSILTDFDLRKGFTGQDIEDLAIELADAIEECDIQRPGHWGHTRDQAMTAFSNARDELQRKKDQGILGMERWEIMQRMIAYHKWGGPMPAAVVMPIQEDPKGPWRLMVPDENGNPLWYKTRPGSLEDLMPPPTDRSAAAMPDGHGIGYHVLRPSPGAPTRGLFKV